MLRLLFCCFLCTAWHSACAQVIIPAAARFIQTDELGNVYLVRTDNTLTRYNEQGDSSAFYRAVNNGDIGAVDATNPLEVLVYYPQQSRIVVLDRMLTVKETIDLRKENLYTPPAIARSADNNIWVYDPFNARVRKLYEVSNILYSSNDLRQQTGFVPQPTMMTERDRRLYLCDSVNGILLFDRYGTYLETLPFKGLSEIQVVGQQLIYRHADSLVSYNMQSFQEKKMPLPGGPAVLQALISHGHIYLRYTDRVEVNPIP